MPMGWPRLSRWEFSHCNHIHSLQLVASSSQCHHIPVSISLHPLAPKQLVGEVSPHFYPSNASCIHTHLDAFLSSLLTKQVRIFGGLPTQFSIHSDAHKLQCHYLQPSSYMNACGRLTCYQVNQVRQTMILHLRMSIQSECGFYPYTRTLLVTIYGMTRDTRSTRLVA